MSYVNFNRKLSRSAIESLTNATNGKLYFATDGGIYLGESDGTTTKKADINDNIIGGAKGSIPYQTSPDNTAFLPIGTNGQVLKINSNGLPYWAADNNTDTKVTQTITTSTSNTSYRPLLLGYSTSDATTFAPATVTNTTYATHLAKFQPSTGRLFIGGLGELGTDGKEVAGSTTSFFNTNGTVTNLSTSSVQYATSASNADTVDGKHATDFATSSHNHNGGAVKTAWGQTYVNASGALQTISGNMTSVGTITATGDNTITKSSTDWAKFKATNNNGSVSLGSSTNRGVYDETKARWIIAVNPTGTNVWAAPSTDTKLGIGTESPTEKLHVIGNIKSSGSVLAGTYVEASTYARIKGGDIYAGTSSGAQCHLQYDATDECMKFIFD